MAEYIVITQFVQPMPSTRLDWQFATVLIAPMSAALLLWFAIFIVRIVDDVWTFLKFLGRLIDRDPRRHPPRKAPSSSSTEDASSSSRHGC
jgi:hypothetical protein